MQHKWPIYELNRTCEDCKFYIENNPIKNVYPKDLCTNEENKQNALNGDQFMQVNKSFYCNRFLTNDTENENENSEYDKQ